VYVTVTYRKGRTNHCIVEHFVNAQRTYAKRRCICNHVYEQGVNDYVLLSNETCLAMGGGDGTAFHLDDELDQVTCHNYHTKATSVYTLLRYCSRYSILQLAATLHVARISIFGSIDRSCHWLARANLTIITL
jgi:hypothetical protein